MNDRRRTLLPLLALWIAALSAGCQNTLELRVQRVCLPEDTQLRPNSSLGAALTKSVENLEKVVQYGQAFDSRYREFVNGLSQRHRAIFEPALAAYVDRVKEIQQEASELAQTCRAYFETSDATGQKAEIKRTLNEITALFGQDVRELQSLWAQAKQVPSIRALTTAEPPGDDRAVADAMEAQAGFRQCDAASRKVTGLASRGVQDAKVGFGGFVATDVYEINPSDPGWARVFGSRRGGSRVSREPISRVSLGVSGDSAAMVVAEHPGQMRVYQISNDPTQLAGNVALLVSKAVAAAAKFTNAGLF